MTRHDDDHSHEHDLGLAHDLKVMTRRRMFILAGGVGASSLAAACASSVTGTTTSVSAAASASALATESVAQVPAETAGPYPGDGSNGPNILIQNGVVRKDLRKSFGDYAGTADGVDMQLTMTLVDLNTKAAGKGMAVYIWHCTADGEYSLYRNAAEANYLRGVQVAGDDGTVTFTSIFPGCYSGRWPHIHFEVYDSLEAAVAGSDARLTSQIALPEDACRQIYDNDARYSSSISNLESTSLSSDNVFGDGWTAELATATGSASKMNVSLTVGVADESENQMSDGGRRRGRGMPAN
ncbi:MAG: dioxygenase [Nocardiaceae bacterium]|nr:dioxygenase [Nocardiaceae bacterium]